MAKNFAFADVLSLEVQSPDSVIQYGAKAEQFGELWLPDNTASALIILIHGGCWLNSFDVEHSRPLASALSGEGFAVWSIEYRRLGDTNGGIPGTFDDIDLATRHLEILKSHQVPTDRVIVAGHSAGGHLALWLAATFPERFSAAVGLAAITDLASYAQGQSSCEQAALQLMGGLYVEAPENYKKYSPAELTPHPKTHLTQGQSDSIVPQSQAFALRLNEENVHLTTGGHFDIIHPGTQDFEMLKRVLERVNDES